jgi:hypothetical protein
MADEAVTLQIFNLIEENPNLSEKKITSKTGLAAGLVHSFMRHVLSKGLIRAKKVSPKRWLYFITPAGFLLKSTLTLKYFKRTFEAFKNAQKAVKVKIDSLYENNHRQLVIAADNELANIVSLNINEKKGLELVAIVSKNPDNLEGLNGNIVPISKLESLEYDRLLICDPEFESWMSEEGIEVSKEKIVHFVSDR